MNWETYLEFRGDLNDKQQLGHRKGVYNRAEKRMAAQK